MGLSEYCIHGNKHALCCACRDRKRITELESALAKSASREAALVMAMIQAEKSLNAMLTHMGMDEDEWNKPTFDQARDALAKIKEAS